jgi:general secretion pathway protein A
MYQEWFGLDGPPFDLTSETGSLYMSPQHREAMAALEWGLTEPNGITLLVGQVGMGKTSLVLSLISQPIEGLRIVYLGQPKLSFEEILRFALGELGIEGSEFKTRLQLLKAMEVACLALGRDERIVLIFDEAQSLSDELLEDLRLLSNETPKSKGRLQIVIVGQSELRERLLRPPLRNLDQRIGTRVELSRLSKKEGLDYVAHRVRAKGGDAGAIFKTAALRKFVAHGLGIPRRINVVCHNSMVLAYAAGARRVTARMVSQVVAENATATAAEPSPGFYFGNAWRLMRSDSVRLGLALTIGAAAIGLGTASHSLIGARAAAPPVRANETHKRLIEHSQSAGSEGSSASADTRQPVEGHRRSNATRRSDDQLAANKSKSSPSVAERLVPVDPIGAESPITAKQPESDREVWVKSGDTLAQIALSYLGPDLDSELSRLIEANPQIANVDIILPGEKIRLPPRASTTALPR